MYHASLGSMVDSTLTFYAQVYNRNGRIGIYTPAERAAIIARFNAKRQRRVWNKKIRYNCRKSLADRRLRVKGRFVKRSEQEQLAREIQARVEQKVAEDDSETTERDDEHKDEDMPDVNDPEAGFVPTEDQPYRRMRRYTITSSRRHRDTPRLHLPEGGTQSGWAGGQDQKVMTRL